VCIRGETGARRDVRRKRYVFTEKTNNFARKDVEAHKYVNMEEEGRSAKNAINLEKGISVNTERGDLHVKSVRALTTAYMENRRQSVNKDAEDHKYASMVVTSISALNVKVLKYVST